MKKALYIIGAGGHARTVAEAALSLGRSIVYVTEKPAPGSQHLSEADFLKQVSQADQPVDIICGIGSVAWMHNRATILNKYKAECFSFVSIVHPAAMIADSCVIGRGVFVARGAILCPDAEIGLHSIINTGAIVEHDSHIGENCHTAPGSILCGGVRIGRDVMIGANATVLQERKIASSNILAAGAVLTRDIVASGQTWVGMPAAPLQSRREEI